MVAEKTGIIRFYDIITCQPIMSLDCGHAPLTSADWCRTDPLTVGAVAGSDWFMWDVTRSSRPEDRRQVHPEGAKNFRCGHGRIIRVPGQEFIIFFCGLKHC